MTTVVGVPKQLARSKPKKPIDYERVKTQLLAMFEVKARARKKALDRAGFAQGDRERKLQVPPKWLAEAQRIGLTEIHGLKLVL